jgi:hypothetical protein
VGEERELSDEEITSLRRRLLEQRVMDLVLTTAEWVEVEEGESLDRSNAL